MNMIMSHNLTIHDQAPLRTLQATSNMFECALNTSELSTSHVHIWSNFKMASFIKAVVVYH